MSGEGLLVRHGTEVGPKDCVEFLVLWKPVVVSYERDSVFVFGGILLVDIEEVSLGEEWLWDPPVDVHAVDGNRFVISIDDNPLVNSLLVSTHFIGETFILIVSFDDFDGIGVNHLDAGNGSVGCSQTVEECPHGTLTPVDFFEVVLGDHVFVILESENHFVF